MTGVAVVGLLAAAAIVLNRGGGIDHPEEWDRRVVDLVAFVERERGIEFDHPVEIEFLSEREYSERVRVDETALTDQDRALVEESSTVLEALGLVPLDTDLFESSNEMADAGTLAFYDPVIERVIVRGTEMTTGVEVTLVHELVHVAQDQAFDLERPPATDTSAAYEAFDALVEGDAVRIELDYVDSLSADEQTGYWDDYGAAYDESQAALTEVPPALQALFAAPYLLGQPVVDLLAADGGNEAVDDAFADPPVSSEHLLDPRSYFDGDAPIEVDEPEIGDGSEAIGEPSPLGATTLFVMLAERIDPLVALAAADGWGGDMSVAYDDGDGTCVRVDLVGDTATDRDEIAAALQAWVDAGPAGAASVTTSGDRVVFESCSAEVEADAAPPAAVSSLDALVLPATRSQLMMVATSDLGLDHDEAFALGDCFVRRVPLATLVEANAASEPSAELAALIDDTMAACMTG
jgi:hypothetical protein